MSKLVRLLGLFRRPEFEPDPRLDGLIRDVLRQEAAVAVPVGSWERLRKSIADRKPVRTHGMWLLDEPLRDPPKSPPTTLSDPEFERALRLYIDARLHQPHSLTIKAALWSNVAPSFAVLVNW